MTFEHDADHDAGVRWDSIPGLRWPFDPPTVSDRDASLPRLDEFVTPFVLEAADA